MSRSWTTRTPRANEAPDAYTFVDRPTFEAAIAAGRFLEWDEHLGHLYGTPVPHPPDGKDVVLEIDINGAENVRQKLPDTVVVLIVPPSREELERRLLARGDNPESVAARLQRADMELDRGRKLADAVVVNDDLDRAVDDLAGILDGYRQSPRRES